MKLLVFNSHEPLASTSSLMKLDIHRMQLCLEAEGYVADEKDLYKAWRYASSKLSEIWKKLPEADVHLVEELLLLLNVQPGIWIANIIDPGDSSGDRIFELPDELLSLVGWKIGDTIKLTKHTDNIIHIYKP